MISHRVVLTRTAERQMASLSTQGREMIAAALIAIGSNPRPYGCRTLTDTEDLWLVRVREYRVVYQIRNGTLIVTGVKTADPRRVRLT